MDAEQIIKSLTTKFPDVISDAKVDSDIRISAYSEAEKIVEVCKYLKEELQFGHLSAVTAIDQIQKNEIDVVYLIASYDHPVVLKLKARLPRDNPEIESIVPVYWNANWYERETYELFGVQFKNHPDLRNLVLPDELLGDWPLRKDYKGFPNRTAKNLV
ncbi:F420H2 dehydrogenase subunit FpoC [Methanohalophilus sp.]|uniref:F420H2 dehydrogenase subunit FpoC n=1 Tax=Methanohalophilus sp. TaxID=1966352 RepID=UPI002611ECD8|nr:F420H2 dehydrogenase subunit FpoC [Methanohalophilus sp.]MDK2892141.1 dehydrogenase subunit [Methanohalophilus sp.]